MGFFLGRGAERDIRNHQTPFGVVTTRMETDLSYCMDPTRDKKVRGPGRNEAEWTWKVEMKKEETLGSRRSMHGYILTYSNLYREWLWQLRVLNRTEQTLMRGYILTYSNLYREWLWQLRVLNRTEQTLMRGYILTYSNLYRAWLWQLRVLNKTE